MIKILWKRKKTKELVEWISKIKSKSSNDYVFKFLLKYKAREIAREYEYEFIDVWDWKWLGRNDIGDFISRILDDDYNNLTVEETAKTLINYIINY